MKKLIRELFRRKLFESENENFFKDRAGIPDYDAILFGKRGELPEKYADWVAEIEWMSKEDYYRECARLQNTGYNDQFKYLIPDKVKKIEANMAKGIKYDLPYLNYVDGSQEGRHRVMAASNLGQERIPVLILDKEEKVSRHKISDMVGIWDDLVKDKNNYYIKASAVGWKGLYSLLGCVASDFDNYYLDELSSLITAPSLFPNILSIIKNKIKWIDTRVNQKYINYHGDIEASDEILKLCVVFRCLKNNDWIIYNIRKKGDEYYLPIPDNISGDFDDYGTCMEMLKSLGHEYYISEYGLLSTEDDNSLYDIEDADIKVIKELLLDNKKN